VGPVRPGLLSPVGLRLKVDAELLLNVALELMKTNPA
jgi:Ni,Fe-hydrogenase III large subunit